jgi:hypothetical protein
MRSRSCGLISSNADQIFQRETTEATRAKNADLVLQYKSETEQKGKEVLSEQRSKLVDANRDLKVAKTLAQQQKERGNEQ